VNPIFNGKEEKTKMKMMVNQMLPDESATERRSSCYLLRTLKIPVNFFKDSYNHFASTRQ